MDGYESVTYVKVREDSKIFGGHFYHQRIRKAVAAFGSLFNQLYVLRKDGSGNVISQVRVPLSYAPRDKYLERIRVQEDLENDQAIALKLPRMSFEITSFNYDGTRQVAKTNKFSTFNTDTSKKVFYAGVPYNIFFSLSIYAKTQDDALQVVEQIIPYFNPQYTLTMKPFPDYPTIKEDIPLTIVSTSFSDDFEGPVESRRTIIYTLEFEMKSMFYGPIGDQSIIREIQNNFYLINGEYGDEDSDGLVSTATIVPDPLDAGPDSDYGFTITWNDYIG